MVSLFLVTEAFDNTSSSIPLIQSLGDGGNAVVIALDFWAKKKLRQKGIPYKTPDEYLDVGTCEDIDIKAIEMAQTWYKSLGDRLAYKNIPLGEMSEYDFGFLFIETLRSIELATKILSCESPSMIFLPQKFPQSELIELDTMCYRTLPEALRYFAKLNNIPVTIVYPSPKAVFLGNIESLKSRAGAFVLDIAIKGYNFCRSIPVRFGTKGKNLILFLNERALCSKIGAEMDKKKYLALPIGRLRVQTRETRRKNKEIRRLWGKLEQDREGNARLVYNNVPLFEILNYRFQHFFHAQASDLIGYIEWADKIIRVLKPKMLVVMEDVMPISRTMCRTFKHHGLPTLVIQHAAPTSTTNERGIYGFYVNMPLQAQRQAVWGDFYREEWGSKRGKPAESQVVVGNPRYDFIVEDYRPQKSEICHKLGLVPERGIIVVAGAWYASGSAAATIEVGEHFIRSTIKALKNFPEEQIVIKLHPAFYKRYRQIIAAIAEEENIEVTITKDYLWELLAVSDLVIVTESTVGLDAMVLDKPVVVVKLNSRLGSKDYISGGVALGAYSPGDIAPVVREVLHNEQVRQELAEARKRFVYEHAYIQDGKASKRIAELIAQMIQMT